MDEIVSTLLVDRACVSIKDDIYEKKLIPGQKIILRELAERYNISATPIKQALNRLVSEGIVESIPRRGMIVCTLSEKDIENTAETRRMIELYSVPYAIEYASKTPDFIEQLSENLGLFEDLIPKAYNTGYFVDLHKTDFEFHKLLVSTIKNQKIDEIYANLGTHCCITYLYGKKELNRTLQSLEEHQAILDALCKGSEGDLSAAVSLHIDSVRREYAQNVSEYNY